MKSKMFTVTFSILVLASIVWNALLFAQQTGNKSCKKWMTLPEGCTVVIVGKDASVDGSAMVTHTNDCGVCDWSWRYVPPADHEPGSKRRIYWFNQYETSPPSKGYHWSDYEHKFSGLEIEEIPHTFGYLHGMYGYLNDNQVALGESTIGCRRQLRNSTTAPKFDITNLSIIAMERGTSARHAIQLMGDLATTYGFGHTDGGEMLAVVDKKEAWIFEVMPVGPLWNPDMGTPGAIWCAQRIPNDHVSVVPNESRIDEIDLNDTDRFMHSKNVISQAVDMGFYDPESGEPFSWKKAYSPRETSAAESRGRSARLWRFMDLVAPSKQFSPDTPNMDFPYSIKPDEKLSVTDVFDILRDNYEGTEFDLAKGIMGGPFQNPNYTFRRTKIDDKTYVAPRSIGMNRSEHTTVIQVRDWLPDPIGGIVWLSLGSLNTTCFVPFYMGITRIPKSYEFGDHWEFDRRVARWAFDYADFHTQVVYSYAIQDVREAQKRWELSAVERTTDIDAKALSLHQSSPDKAKAYLTEYCCNNATAVVNAWWELGDDLLVKYNHFRSYNVQERKSGGLDMPEEWIRALIQVNGLKPLPARE